MQHNFIILRTDKGGRYARKILRSIKWLNENKYPQHEFSLTNITISDFLHNLNDIERNYRPENTIIHARAANPRTEWTIKLRRLQDMGYKVVNSVDAIELTSNKLACSMYLHGRVAHPKTWEYRKNMTYNEAEELIADIYNELPKADFIIAKPITSLEQGANVKKIEIGEGFEGGIDDLRQKFDQIPGSKAVIQEYVPYTALHRVIVIGGKALPYTFVDYADDPRKNGEWKVSCCLNRTTMQFNGNPSPRLLQLAEETQREVGGVINFIDIFEYPITHPEMAFGGVGYTNAEINTACSLNIHEKLAKDAGRRDWNIHYRIAKQLVKELLGA